MSEENEKNAILTFKPGPVDWQKTRIRIFKNSKGYNQ